MTMTHEQIDEQMVDFLYGELPADARAAFEAHVAGCERCRREVESFGQVRAVARTVLDETPPARVHDAVMRAAREAVAAAPAKAAAPREAQKEAKKKAEPSRASLWDWLRVRWAFPALATVGALTVFILGSRVFLNPNTVREIGRPAPVSEPAASSPASPAAESAPATGVAPAPTATPEPEAKGNASAAAEARPEAQKRKEISRHFAPPRAPGGGAGVFGAAPKDDPLDGLLGSASGAREKNVKRDDLLDGIKEGGRGGKGEGAASSSAPAKKSAEKKSAFRNIDEMEEDRLQAREQPARDKGAGAQSRAYAPPPPPAAAPAAAPSYAEPPPPKATVESESYAADDSADLAKSAPRRVERPMSRSSRGGGPATPAPAPQPAPVAALASAGKSKRARVEAAEEAEAGDVAVRETLVQRADRLFTQGRWAEAAIAYRDLLRQQPNSPDAERWRRRLAAARAAITTDRPPPPSR